MKKIIIILLSILPVLSWSQEKKALVIANYDYKETSGWGKTNADADIKYIVHALNAQGFSDNDITVVENVDKASLIASLKEFRSKLKQGNAAVIHFSGHGQQVTDKEGEEIDGLDEALVPIDAPKNSIYGGDNYRGEKHFTDDEVGEILKSIRSTLGKEGHLVMLMDACHSGTGTRGGKNIARGTSTPYTWESIPENTRGISDNRFLKEDEDDMANCVLFFGASAHQLNYETIDEDGNPVGSLSYAFAKAFTSLKEDQTYRQLFANIQSIMAVKASNQDPLVEGDIDLKIFDGEIVPQTHFYSFEKRLNEQTYLINGGYLTGVTLNSIVGLYPQGTTDPHLHEDKLISKGKIINAGAVGSSVQFDNTVDIDNLKDYYIFLLEKNLDESKMLVKIDDDSKKSSKLSQIQRSLQEKNVFDFTESSSAEIILSEQQGKIFITSSDTTWTCPDVTKCIELLQVYAEGSFLKKLSFYDRNYQVDIKFIPVVIELGINGPQVTDTLDINDYTTSSGIEFPVGMFFLLEVENTGKRDGHFAILDIQPDGFINQVLPFENSITPEECFLKVREKKIIKNAFFQIGPPYGRETYKVLAAKDPINTQTIVTTRGKTGHRAGMSSLELLVKDTYGTRGSQTNSFSASPSTGSCKNVHFKIVE